MIVDYGPDFFKDKEPCNCKQPNCKYKPPLDPTELDTFDTFGDELDDEHGDNEEVC